MVKIYIGSDHAGFKLKEKMKLFLDKSEKYFWTDLGAHKLKQGDDYLNYAMDVAKAVVFNKDSFGILICGSGHGVCIVANKVKGIRAALCENLRDAYNSRNDDDANVLCLQGRYTKVEDAKKIVKKFLETNFSGEARHLRRVNQIKKLENRNI